MNTIYDKSVETYFKRQLEYDEQKKKIEKDQFSQEKEEVKKKNSLNFEKYNNIIIVGIIAYMLVAIIFIK